MGREVRVVSVDFSLGLEIYPSIAENIQDLEIGVLGMLIRDLCYSLSFIKLHMCYPLPLSCGDHPSLSSIPMLIMDIYMVFDTHSEQRRLQFRVP